MVRWVRGLELWGKAEFSGLGSPTAPPERLQREQAGAGHGGRGKGDPRDPAPALLFDSRPLDKSPDVQRGTFFLPFPPLPSPTFEYNMD